MAELAINDLVTPALRAKLAQAGRRLGDEAEVVALTPERIVKLLRDAGIGVIDLDRQRCLVDERVYESALARGRVGGLYLKRRKPAPEVWLMINGRV